MPEPGSGAVALHCRHGMVDQTLHNPEPQLPDKGAKDSGHFPLTPSQGRCALSLPMHSSGRAAIRPSDHLGAGPLGERHQNLAGAVRTRASAGNMTFLDCVPAQWLGRVFTAAALRTELPTVAQLHTHGITLWFTSWTYLSRTAMSDLVKPKSFSGTMVASGKSAENIALSNKAELCIFLIASSTVSALDQ